MLRCKVSIDTISVSTTQRKTLHPEIVYHFAEAHARKDLKTPINVQVDGNHYVLIGGAYTGLKSRNWLGEKAFDVY